MRAPEIQRICDEECSEDSGNFPERVKYMLSYKLSVINEDGSTSNYDSNSLANWLAEQGWDADLMYSSKEDAQSDIEDFRYSVMSNPDTQKYTESVNLAPQPEISLTIEDQSTGHVLAMVGGRGVPLPGGSSMAVNFQDSEIERTTRPSNMTAAFR